MAITLEQTHESCTLAAKTGLDVQQTRMTVDCRNNLANVNTTGRKKARAVFEDLAETERAPVGAATPQAHSGADRLVARHWRARRRDAEKNYSQGNMQTTGDSARRRCQRPRLLPGADAGRHARLHA